MKNMDFYEGKGGFGLDNFQSGVDYYLETINRDNIKNNPEILLIYLDCLCGEELKAVAGALLTYENENDEDNKVQEKAVQKMAEIRVLEKFGITKNFVRETVATILLKEIDIEELIFCLTEGKYCDKVDEILGEALCPEEVFSTVKGSCPPSKNKKLTYKRAA